MSNSNDGAGEQRILDRYLLVERLATGGTATVWRAVDEQLDRPVAVKLLHPHLLPDETSRRRLAAEARAAASLSHPGVVGVYDVDAGREAAALVMELVDGESLAARIARDGALPEREVARIVAEVADALYHAHQRGVVHRDVKPGNILLDRAGRAHLVDFGIAHSLGAAAERLTLAGTVIGTLRYMAPEQLAGEPVGPRSDLFGLGAVFHEALTGRPPYAAASPVALVREQAAGAPPLDGVDPALAAAVRSCLSVDVRDRPLHAGALAAALRDWLEGRPQAALALAPSPAGASRRADTQAITRAMPAAAPVAPGARPVGATPAGRDRRPAARRRSVLPLVPLALAGLVLAGALAVVFLGPFDDLATMLAPAPTPTPTATPTPAPTATPRWMGELLEDYLEACPGGDADAVAAELVTLGEEAGEQYVRDLADACEEAREDEDDGEGGGGGNGGGGNGGPGGGNGPPPGRGGGDD